MYESLEKYLTTDVVMVNRMFLPLGIRNAIVLTDLCEQYIAMKHSDLLLDEDWFYSQPDPKNLAQGLSVEEIRKCKKFLQVKKILEIRKCKKNQQDVEAFRLDWERLDVVLREKEE